MANYEAGNLILNTGINDVDKTLANLDKIIARLTTIQKLSSKSGSISSTIAGSKGKSAVSSSKAADDYVNNVTKINKRIKLSGLINISKMSAAVMLGRRLGNTLKAIIKYGSDFDETLNMWQVAFRDNIDRATEFINKMHTAYGISTETLMRNQAIYKNMLSQMGQLTEETSYRLSESLTIMMLDYASLWNTTIDQASEKFKAMLAGQIRPIRAVSGISVEEQAIFDIYRGMGGQKTMRQLTQVEKRLLRIYATFSQMQQSGATGDFAKTIENFANQSRLMKEHWKEFVTWLGIGIKELIEASGIMQYINAALITMTNIVKALLKDSGYEQKNFLTGMLETAEATNEEVTELQGKLLGFDKFRALEDTTGQSALAIDQKVLDLLASYNSSLDKTTNKAQLLAEKWSSLFIDDNGELTKGAELLFGSLKAILGVLGSIIVLGLPKQLASIIPLLGGLTTATASLGKAATPLTKVAHATLIGSKEWHEQAIKNRDILIANRAEMLSFSSILSSISTIITTTVGSFLFFDTVIGMFGEDMRKTVSIISIVVGSLVTLLGVMMAINAYSKGTGFMGASLAIGVGLGALLAGIKGTVNANKVQEYANGGMPDKGTLFVAGEAGAEIVSTSSSGQTGVSNVDQIAQATYRGNMMFWQQAKRDIERFGGVVISADSEGIFKIVRGTAKKQGLDFAKV